MAKKNKVKERQQARQAEKNAKREEARASAAAAKADAVEPTLRELQANVTRTKKALDKCLIDIQNDGGELVVPRSGSRSNTHVRGVFDGGRRGNEYKKLAREAAAARKQLRLVQPDEEKDASGYGFMQDLVPSSMQLARESEIIARSRLERAYEAYYAMSEEDKAAAHFSMVHSVLANDRPGFLMTGKLGERTSRELEILLVSTAYKMQSATNDPVSEGNPFMLGNAAIANKMRISAHMDQRVSEIIVPHQGDLLMRTKDPKDASFPRDLIHAMVNQPPYICAKSTAKLTDTLMKNLDIRPSPMASRHIQETVAREVMAETNVCQGCKASCLDGTDFVAVFTTGEIFIPHFDRYCEATREEFLDHLVDADNVAAARALVVS